MPSRSDDPFSGEMFVTIDSHGSISWRKQPKGTWIATELINSDAWRSLSKFASDLLLWIYTRRQYPPKSRTDRDGRSLFNYWEPTNAGRTLIPYKTIEKFFDQHPRMYRKPPSKKTIKAALDQLMARGFISLEKLGGDGAGDMNYYRLTNNWRVWRDGDPDVFTRSGKMRKGRGWANRS